MGFFEVWVLSSQDPGLLGFQGSGQGDSGSAFSFSSFSVSNNHNGNHMIRNSNTDNNKSEGAEIVASVVWPGPKLPHRSAKPPPARKTPNS